MTFIRTRQASLKIFRRPKMNFLRQGFRKSSYYIHTYTIQPDRQWQTYILPQKLILCRFTGDNTRENTAYHMITSRHAAYVINLRRWIGNHLYPIIKNFWRSVDIYHVTLTFDPLTLSIFSVSTVTWSNSVQNFSEIEQSAARGTDLHI